MAARQDPQRWRRFAAMPTVSIILPTFNRTDFLQQAIASVSAQSWQDWELIVADDGSDEATQMFLRSLADRRVRIVWLAHCGNPARVRNQAIAAARGQYLAFLDSDDLWAPAKLDRQLRVLSETGARWSYTACDRIDRHGAPLPGAQPAINTPAGWILEPLLRQQVSIAMPSLIAERELVQTLGGFDEQQLYGEFHELCLRLAMHAEAAPLSEPLCSVRAHDQHYSAERGAAFSSWMRLYEKIGELVPSAELRTCCERRRADFALRLAGWQAAHGQQRQGWRTLAAAAPYSIRYPRWWWGVLKQAARPVVTRLRPTAGVG
jgi:glycosyltransferase involved in cell wall biosynthesis